MNRLCVLRLGSSRVDKGAVIVPEVGVGTWVTTPVYGYLIEQKSGNLLLIDTGLNSKHIDDPTFTLDEDFAKVLTPIMHEQDRLEARLDSAGFTLSDVDAVINTHFHFDHAGNNSLLSEKPIFIQREHYEFAVGNPQFPNINWNLPDLNYQFLDGESEVFEGVEIVLTPGHAPAHQSLVVTLGSGRKILLCIDAIYSRENLERDSWSTQADPETARESAIRLMRIMNENDALPIFGHDHLQMDELDYAPVWYE